MGGENRNMQLLNFSLYIFWISINVISIIYLANLADSFAIEDFYYLNLSFEEEVFLLLAFLIGFGIKKSDVVIPFMVARCPCGSANKRVCHIGLCTSKSWWIWND